MHVDHTGIHHTSSSKPSPSRYLLTTNGTITIAETTSVRLYVIVIINSVVTNDINRISDYVNIITEAVAMNIGETTAVMFTPYHIPTTPHGFTDFYTLSIIVHTRPERTLVAPQADTHAFVPDATHPRSFVLSYNTRHFLCSQANT
jgi:hypothetical protein